MWPSEKKLYTFRAKYELQKVIKLLDNTITPNSPSYRGTQPIGSQLETLNNLVTASDADTLRVVLPAVQCALTLVIRSGVPQALITSLTDTIKRKVGDMWNSNEPSECEIDPVSHATMKLHLATQLSKSGVLSEASAKLMQSYYERLTPEMRRVLYTRASTPEEINSRMETMKSIIKKDSRMRQPETNKSGFHLEGPELMQALGKEAIKSLNLPEGTTVSIGKKNKVAIVTTPDGEKYFVKLQLPNPNIRDTIFHIFLDIVGTTVDPEHFPSPIVQIIYDETKMKAPIVITRAVDTTTCIRNHASVVNRYHALGVLILDDHAGQYAVLDGEIINLDMDAIGNPGESALFVDYDDSEFHKLKSIIQRNHIYADMTQKSC